jgi:hypothetical protein
MKTFVSFCLVVLLVGVGGCKKEKKDACVGIICQNGGHCENGVCVCDSGFSGTQCEVYDSCFNVQCGTHGTCVNGTCICDSGWTGADCSLPPCWIGHTGSVRIICDTTFTYTVTVNGNVKGEVSYHNDLVLSNIPIVTTSFHFVSNQQCLAYVSGHSVNIPCSYFTRNITINECQETTLVIP